MLGPSEHEQLKPAQTTAWTTKSQQEVYANQWTSVIEEQLEGPNGEDGLYAYLAEKDCVIVCPLFPNHDTCLVQQWRHAFNCFTWEFPCGALDAGEEPLAAAKRELAEECGLQAAVWTSYGSLLHSDARVRGRIHFFLARKLGEVESSRDKEEADLESQRVAFQSAIDAIEEGTIEAIMTVYFLQRIQQDLFS